jgi:flagellar biosynthesis/type III secretory pathway protein FliH
VHIYKIPNTANEIIKQTHFAGTKTVILHCGTNDLETASDDESLSSSIVNVVEAITQKLLNCKLIVSSLALLPRLDKLHQNVGIN